MRTKDPTYERRRNVVQVTLTDAELAEFERRCEETFISKSSRARLLILDYLKASKPKPIKK